LKTMSANARLRNSRLTLADMCRSDTLSRVVVPVQGHRLWAAWCQA
jgi:hypothetical protein